jgi:hypothetical protein
MVRAQSEGIVLCDNQGEKGKDGSSRYIESTNNDF